MKLSKEEQAEVRRLPPKDRKEHAARRRVGIAAAVQYGETRRALATWPKVEANRRSRARVLLSDALLALGADDVVRVRGAGIKESATFAKAALALLEAP